jgi:metal-responsive CopG/Arc/MetJ family transcriptional regulator
MKIQISIDDRLLERVDKYADENYMSRSGFASLAMSQYLNQNDMLNLLKELTVAVRKISETGTIDEETKKTLEELQYVYNMCNK